MNEVRFIVKEKYSPSNIKKSDSFANDVKREADERQMVDVDSHTIMFGAEGPVIFKTGKFWTISAEVEYGKWGRHYVMVSPNLKTLIEKGECFIRLDSGCMSGVLGDITCDCLEQLRVAQEEALKRGGIIIHIPDQDGRGWGNDYKMANQRIMHETKMDTISVAKEFYGGESKIDVRTFEESALILKALGFPQGYKFDLGTKNPKKMNALTRAGFDVVSHAVKVNGMSKHLIKNLKAKDEFFNNQPKEKANARD